MTARLTLDIFCDGCGNWKHADGGLDKNKARTFVQERYGWKSKRVGRKLIDLCPNCETGTAPDTSMADAFSGPAIAVTITDLRKIHERQ